MTEVYSLDLFLSQHPCDLLSRPSLEVLWDLSSRSCHWTIEPHVLESTKLNVNGSNTVELMSAHDTMLQWFIAFGVKNILLIFRLNYSYFKFWPFICDSSIIKFFCFMYYLKTVITVIKSLLHVPLDQRNRLLLHFMAYLPCFFRLRAWGSFWMFNSFSEVWTNQDPADQ